MCILYEREAQQLTVTKIWLSFLQKSMHPLLLVLGRKKVPEESAFILEPFRLTHIQAIYQGVRFTVDFTQHSLGDYDAYLDEHDTGNDHEEPEEDR